MGYNLLHEFYTKMEQATIVKYTSLILAENVTTVKSFKIQVSVL